MFKRTLFAFVIVSIVAFIAVPAQNRQPRGEGASGESPSIRGKVIDKQSGHAIEYANVVLYRKSDSSMVQGTVTGEDGNYLLENVRQGTYYLEVRFMGFESHIIDEVQLRGLVTTLETISLEPAAIQMDEVEIAADRAPVTYQIDKKIINVERQLTAASGTAVDVLTNVPSVTVDLDGNVRLRGSGSFTVLIDGRPSPLDGTEALEQIPASAIENIEIITNPSAKYDPEGVSGIINIIMKKDGKAGLTGVFDAGVGTQEQYSGSALVTLRNDGFSWFVGADYMKRGGESTSEERSVFQTPNGPLSVNSDGTSDRAYEWYGVRTGVDLSLSPRDNLGANVQYGYRQHSSNSLQNYSEQLGANDPVRSLSLGEFSRGGYYYSATTDYEHRFEGENHKLNAHVFFRGRTGDEESRDELLDLNGTMKSGRISTEDGPGQMVNARVDYLRPIGEKASIETGFETHIGASDDVTSFSVYDTLSGVYERQSEYDRSTTYSRDIHAVYALTRGELGAFGYQVGLRGEYTYRVVDADQDGTFNIDRFDYFPTLHASYKLSETQQFMGSYTRRIERPRGWYLEPFLTWTDAYNIRSGNPDLQPEYIDSYEIGYQTNFGRNMFSVEGYHRVTHNNIERVQSIFRDNITLSRPANVGSEISSGVELMLNVDPVEFWDVYLMGNLFNNKIEGELNGHSINDELFTWNVRFNNTFKITATTMLQLNAQYNSAEVEAQQREEGFATLDAALRQDLFQRSLAITLNWRDVFHTAKRESYTNGINFTAYRYHLREAPQIMLSVKYFLNSRPEPRDRNRNGNGDMGDEDF